MKKNAYLILGMILTIAGCSSMSIDNEKTTIQMTDSLDQFLFQEKVIDGKYRFYKLMDYQTDPIYLKAINNYYGSFPKRFLKDMYLRLLILVVIIFL